ncbi:transcriptional regulator [Leptospira kmetyi]|uniref:Transcriptional regulator n=1 Tax=Leptospira kmetyi TaxID=408139 RepID=A0AAD0XQE9_9LEPT|nr:DJ-1/PfpI family protein [Leptospira kmetyi]AYV56770.1 transcriptional regulator [Leptospira kmetyi]
MKTKRPLSLSRDFGFKNHSKSLMRILSLSVLAFAFSFCVFTLSAETKDSNSSVKNALSETTSKNQPVVEMQTIPKYQSRFGRTRPVVAVIGDNFMTELTDLVIPYGVLTRSQAADVFALGTEIGTMNLFPAMKIEVQESLSSFDQKFPEGADYVIVPAVHRSENAVLLKWLNIQSSKGATVIGVCDGVWVVANAGLLNGKKATGFWYSLNDLEKKFPNTTWIRNRRYVADGKIVTTTAVTASIPVSLALVEAIANKEVALKVAKDLGVNDWNPAHDSNRFRLTMSSVYTIVANTISFWSHEEIGIPVFSGMDEIKLALVADAYSRTYRSHAVAVADSSETKIKTLNGLILIPDRNGDPAKSLDRMLPKFDSTPAVTEFDSALKKIGETYGKSTAAFVALLLEYPQF